MDDAVGRLDVGGHHGGVVHHDHTAVDGDRDHRATHRGDALAVEGDNHLGGRGHRQHVVGEHRGQKLCVAQQLLCGHAQSGQRRGERLLGRGEHRERARPAQSLHQTSRLHRRYQSRKSTRPHSHLNNRPRSSRLLDRLLNRLLLRCGRRFLDRLLDRLLLRCGRRFCVVVIAAGRRDQRQRQQGR